ncbi:MAG: sigma-70 family RNA polymerase sigma factor, partial [Planctomycetota bacterium]
VRRYVQLVYSASWRVLRDENDATDVTQETFFELTRHAGRISGSLAGWLHRVATQKSIDVIRRSAHRRNREKVYARSRPVEVQSWQDLSEHVDQALDALPDALRSILLDHFVSGRTTAQIAAERGFSQATVSRRVNAGLEQLRGVLRRKGLLVTAAALATMLLENTSQAVSATVMGGLGKMAMVGTTGTATTATQAVVVKVVLGIAAAVGTLSVAGYVHHRRSAPPLPVPTISVEGDTVTAGDDGFATASGDEVHRTGTALITANGAGQVAEVQIDSAPPEVETAVAVQAEEAVPVVPRIPAPARTLRFAGEYSLGVVYVRDEDAVRSSAGSGFSLRQWDIDREHYACARGDVHVPSGKRITLCVRGADVTDERYRTAAESLGPDDLWGLEFFSLRPIFMEDGLVAPIAGLTGLRELTFNSVFVSPQGLALIAELPWLEELTAPMGMSDAGIAQIARMPSLRRLQVDAGGMTDEGLRLLGRMTSLESLDLDTNPSMTDAGLRALAELSSLQYLRLGPGGRFTDGGLVHLAALPALKVLRLDIPNVTDEGLRLLAASPTLERICIGFSGNVTDRGIAYLAGMSQLTSLDVRGPGLTDETLAHLATLPSLEELRLSNTFTDAGIEYLTGLGNLRRLTIDHAGSSALTDRALAMLSGMPSLEELHIGGAEFTAQGIETLACLENLEVLALKTPGLGNETLGLLATLPRLRDLSCDSEGRLTLSGLSALNRLSSLESLSVNQVHQDDGGLDLSGLKYLKRLTIRTRRETKRLRSAFVVDQDDFRDDDLACLSGLTDLEELLLLGPGVSDEGLAHLGCLTNIKRLHLGGGTDLTDEGLKYLAALRRLESLEIRDSRITEQGLQIL